MSNSSCGFSRQRISGNCLCLARSIFLIKTIFEIGMYLPAPLLYRNGSTFIWKMMKMSNLEKIFHLFESDLVNLGFYRMINFGKLFALTGSFHHINQ